MRTGTEPNKGKQEGNTGRRQNLSLVGCDSYMFEITFRGAVWRHVKCRLLKWSSCTLHHGLSPSCNLYYWHTWTESGSIPFEIPYLVEGFHRVLLKLQLDTNCRDSFPQATRVKCHLLNVSRQDCWPKCCTECVIRTGASAYRKKHCWLQDTDTCTDTLLNIQCA